MKATINFYEEIVQITLPKTFKRLKDLISNYYVLSEEDVNELLISYQEQIFKIPLKTEQDYAKYLSSGSNSKKILIEVDAKSRLFKQQKSIILEETKEKATLWNNQGEKVKEILLDNGEKAKNYMKEKGVLIRNILINQGNQIKAYWDNPNEVYALMVKSQQDILLALQAQGEKMKGMMNTQQENFYSMKKQHEDKFQNFKKIQEEVYQTMQNLADKIKQLLYTQGEKINIYNNQGEKVKGYWDTHSEGTKELLKAQGAKVQELLYKQGEQMKSMWNNMDYQAIVSYAKAKSDEVYNLIKQNLPFVNNQEEIKKEAEPKIVIHHNIICDYCNSYPIQGIRYKCTVCNDFDLCEECEKTFGESHDHPLLKIRNSN